MWSTAKVTSLAVVFGLQCSCGCFGCVFVKVMADRMGMSVQRTISYLNCLAGGVFLATSVIFCLPEAREKVAEALAKLECDTEYPVTELLTGVGIIMILLLETSAHTCCHQSDEHVKVCMKLHGKGDAAFSSTAYGVIPTERLPEMNGGRNNNTDAELVNNGVQTNCTSNVCIEHGLQTTSPGSPNAKALPNGILYVQGDGDAGNMDGEPEIIRGKKKSAKVTGIVLLIAYSLHMIFDGLALGLLGSEDRVWTLLLTLCAHKFLVFFTIGFQLYEILNSLRKSFLLIVLLSLVSPIGIIIGIALKTQETTTAAAVATGVLQGLATGTFLYVTFFEILCKEFVKKTPHVLHVVVTFAGFAAASAFGILHEHDHDHGHGVHGCMLETSTVMQNLTTNGL